MTSNKRQFIKLFLLLSSFESLLTLFFVIQISPDPKNAWLLGFSRSRLMIIFGVLLVFITLSGFTIRFVRRTTWSEQATRTFTTFLSRQRNLWIAVLLGAVTAVGASWILTQWVFVATDQQIRAYLERLTPIVIFILITSIQFLILLGSVFVQGRRNKWIFLMAVFGGTVLYSWLFVGEYFLANNLYPAYYVEERYGSSLLNWMPYILFQTAIFIQLPFVFYPGMDGQFVKKRNVSWMLIAILAGYVFESSAMEHAQTINTNLLRSDQDAYVGFTQIVVESKFTYTGFRNRMPGYPYIQAVFCGANIDEMELFDCGKQVNILLSLVSLFLVYRISSRYLKYEYAFALTLVVACSLFIFKAGYYTVEIVYYLFNFAGFVLMCQMLIRQNFWLALGTGLILGMVYLLKSSILPGLALFIVFIVVQCVFLLYRYWKRRETEININKVKKTALGLAVMLVGFIGFIVPYIQESKDRYGQYFYNVNSAFYVWFDTWDEAKEAETNHQFYEGWPDLPADQIPSLQKYLREHEISTILRRLWDGLVQQISYAWIPYGGINYAAIFSILLAIVFLLNRDQGFKFVHNYTIVFLFTMTYFFGYLLLFAWYTPIAGGPRFVYSLSIPYLFSVLFAIQVIIKDLHIQIGNLRIAQTRVMDAIQMIVIALIISDAFVVITKILPNGYYGS